jgi:hypothetical protein
MDFAGKFLYVTFHSDFTAPSRLAGRGLLFSNGACLLVASICPHFPGVELKESAGADVGVSSEKERVVVSNEPINLFRMALMLVL